MAKAIRRRRRIGHSNLTSRVLHRSNVYRFALPSPQMSANVTTPNRSFLAPHLQLSVDPRLARALLSVALPVNPLRPLPSLDTCALMRARRLSFAPPRHARGQASAAGRVLVRRPDGSLAYLPRRSLDFSAGFFPEPVSHAAVVANPQVLAEDVVPASEPVAASVDPPSQAQLREAAATPPQTSAPLLHDPDRRLRQATDKPTARVVRGVEIPLRPPPPASDECCMSGCARCVYDLYGAFASSGVD